MVSCATNEGANEGTHEGTHESTHFGAHGDTHIGTFSGTYHTPNCEADSITHFGANSCRAHFCAHSHAY
jgi:hypothetical protein